MMPMKTQSRISKSRAIPWPKLGKGAQRTRLIGLAACLAIITPMFQALAQQTSEEAQPVIQPPATQQLAATMRANALADLAIMRPAELEQLLAKLKTKEQKDDEAAAEFAILHPAEAEAATAKLKTPAQLQAEAQAAQAVLNPTAFEAARAKLRTAAECLAEEEAAAAIAHPETKALCAPMVPTVFPLGEKPSESTTTP
jgi:hypothetical protein